MNDVYVSRLTELGHYGEAALVAGLSSPQGEFRPAIRHDGLEIVFASNRPGSVGGPSLWVSHRASVRHPWSAPEDLGPMINSGSFENAPYLSGDGRSLYLHAARPDTIGGLDLYVSTRSRHKSR